MGGEEEQLWAASRQLMTVFSCSRVKVLSVAATSHRLFSSALVLYIDVGKTEEVKSFQILELPQRYHGVPGQAVEMVVCRVRPADSEEDWHPKVSCCPPGVSSLHVLISSVFATNTRSPEPSGRRSRGSSTRPQRSSGWGTRSSWTPW